MAKTTALLEYTDSRGVALRVDKDKGVITGVKILGRKSANGREYSEAAIHNAVSLYEGSKVNVDHPAGNASAPRGYGDRIGSIRNVREAADGLYGDLHYNPKHSLAEQLAWDAANSPQNVGLSHNVQGKTKLVNGLTVVESITSVKSVDLVADPATTAGLFESENQPVSLTIEAVKADATIMEALRADFAKQLSESEASKASAAELKTLREELDAFKAKEALAGKRAKVEAKILEAKLPKEVVSEVFIESCLAAADDAALTRLIEDRAAISKGRTYTPPRSTDQTLAESRSAGGALPTDTKSFVAELTKAY